MRVLMIASSYPKYPGEMTAPFIEEIAVAVARRGHEVHVLLPDHPELQRTAHERGVYLHRYRYAPHPMFSVWGYAAALENDVRMRWAAWAVAPLAVLAGWQALQRLAREIQADLLHAHWVIPNGVPALLATWRCDLPLIVSLHGSDISVAERMLPTALIARSVLRHAREITAPSTDLTSRAAALGAPIDRLNVLPYCVDAEQFQPDAAARATFRRAHAIADDEQLVFAVGRMVEKKGFIYLLRAFGTVLAACPRARLMIAGYGDGHAALQAEADQLGIADRVLFPGPIGHDTINTALNGADVFVLPSVRDSSGNVDGLPNTLLEAMGAGRPIVASHIAGVPGVITSGQHGLLVPPADSAALAGAIIDLLHHPARAAQLGANARQRVEHELTWAAYAARLERLYHASITTFP